MIKKRACPKCGCEHSGSSSRCKKCYADWAREWRRKNPEKAKTAQLNYRIRHPEKMKEIYRKTNLRKSYGITIKDYDELLERQHFRCAICDTETPGGPGRMMVDHNHVTEKVRGLLCCNCNFVIGHCLESKAILVRAIRYLEKEV